MRKLIVFAAAGLLSVSVLLAAKSHSPKIAAERIRQHVKYLSSDALEGRGTGQKGGDAAADYIAAQFKSYGLKPAGENGTYFQSVPLVGVKTLPETSFALLPASGEPLVLRNLDDFVTSNETQTASAEIDAPIVFVGYGIAAPEEKWDDYKGYDLKGKVALLFVNEPISDDPNFFKGKALTYNGRWTYKYEETARRGAVATLIIHRTDLASYGWEVVRNSWGGERSYLKLDGTPKLEAASWIQEEVARKLVGMAGLDLDKLFLQSQSREFKPIELPVHLKAHVVSALRPFSSRNVLGMVAGSNYDMAGEAVLYTAHYDHFGIDRSKPGDNIYHGAIDNGTGCGILLEIARAWGATKTAPRRSILLAAVTAEEQGLLGSEYLGKHSLELSVDPILDLNYDALAPIGIPEEVEVSGAERTTFYPTVEKIAGEFGLAIRPDAHPEAGHYYRSDHFSLSRVGIPSFSIGQGRKFKGHDLAWGEAQAKDYVDSHYHKPADAFREDWDFAGLVKMASFGYALGQAAAEQEWNARWLPGDEFEKAWQKYQSGAIDTDTLFAGHPELKIVHFEPIQYPPLARQTRISGSVVAHVSVASNGKVTQVKTEGHPLLAGIVRDRVKMWVFEPGSERTFDLTCDFVLDDNSPRTEKRRYSVLEPLHIRAAAYPSVVTDVY
ncbi:MAG TPA: M28 family peptidase [Candidatus Dormibacteraeota bacterium]|nr:M28 family peptidase [Candidatus Dormibacteraeota bacterium]